MPNTNLPANRDNARTARLVDRGPVGNWLHGLFTENDYDRQVKAIQKLRDGCMKHGHVKMSSRRVGKIHTDKGDISYTRQYDGEYRW